jgi:hypothetical protein
MSLSNKSIHRVVQSALLATLCAAAACGSPPASESEAPAPIDTHPATFEAARASLDRIKALQQTDPNDPVAAQAEHDIQASLDALNHLVARVEPQTGHVVSFYESTPGVIGVSESGPVGDKSLLADLHESSMLDLYRKVAGAEPPAALLDAALRAKPTAYDPTALHLAAGPVSGSTSQPWQPAPPGKAKAMFESGQQYAANGCYSMGDVHACLPTWWNGGWAESNTKSSFINVASLTGTIYVQGKYQGQVVNVDPVFANQWLYWYRSSGTYCVETQGGNVDGWECIEADYYITDQRWDILYATNQEFDWSYEFRWSCYDGDPTYPFSGTELCSNPSGGYY